MAWKLLFGKLAKGGVVRVDVEDGLPVFTYPEGAAPKAKTKAKGTAKKTAKTPRGKGKGKNEPALAE